LQESCQYLLNPSLVLKVGSDKVVSKFWSFDNKIGLWAGMQGSFAALYCIVLYCAVQFYTVQYSAVQYNTVLYCIVETVGIITWSQHGGM
jgi:hypothetical protein